MLSHLGYTDANADEFDWTADYVCECSDGSSASCDDVASCGANDYVRRYIEVTIARDYSPVFDYAVFADSINLTGFVRLQVDGL